MLQFIAIILSIGFALASAEPIEYVSNGTSWKCPSSAKVGIACQCDAVKSTIHCNRPSYKQMNDFFDELKSINNGSIRVDLFKLENYENSTLDLYIFAPCIGECKLKIDLKFGTIDLRNNKKLKLIGTDNYVDDGKKISVQNFLISNCSLKLLFPNDFTYYGLMMIGSELEYADFSHNYLNVIANKKMFDDGYNWPNLKTFNLSWNQFTEIGYQWFKTTPNVDIIDLSHNYIQNLWNEAFTMNNPDPDKINKKIIINLSNNKLGETSQFASTIFESLRRPSTILLSDNDFHYLPRIFGEILNKRGNSIDMGNNSLICDCNSEWLRSMALIYEQRLINYTCLNLNNTSIFKITKSLCKTNF